MPPDPIIDEEEYESSQDSDFAPDDGVAAEGDSEASESEADGDDAATKTTTTAAATTTKRKRDTNDNEAEDAGFENSGDEALIKKATKKQKRRKAKDADGVPDEEDEGGEGGLVKTRSMRAGEKEERKTAVASGPVTVDVDAIWAQMLAGQTATPSPAGQGNTTVGEAETPVTKQPGAGAAADAAATEAEAEAAAPTKPDGVTAAGDPAETIRIKRTYNFAGKVHTEEKLVARSSAEAKLYLASLGKDASAAALESGADADADEEPKRVLKKAFRSAFEPVVEVANQRRADLNLGVTLRIQAREKAAAQAKKLNTVEKSKMDWAGFVDKEGLKDELELAGRAKGSYAERQDFLARSEAKRDEEARRARMAGRVL
ncbi:bucentaur or craniofacial development [Colletotrichum higginsianum IMI 349063]|uniref:SWR1-complex protein 5 n=2 Tax=Colletotrichum higginsianum TaxID=80884 RepID=A0A1B7YQE9_COLHI|nr:bucentaur or craniofacial development [Colletotrichum higginsianum IMI 349063]OBR14182.1 bucentaur or craniofacial development [Colletotrichum higginsianum IMI 349063]TID01560.1 SWR1-complex protein 5 [Colletotrichum higginsianum]